MPYAFPPGVATFPDVWGFTVVYRLGLRPDPGPARLPLSPADTSCCLEAAAPRLTLSLESFAHISSWHGALGYFDEALDLPPASTPC